MREFIRTTLIGGILFLIPLVMVVVVFGKAFQILKTVANPLVKLIPIESIAGFALVEVLTAVIMLLCCLMAGLVARSQWGRNIYAKIDSILLELIPGYSWVKGVTGDISDAEAENIFEPVLVRLDDQYQLGFEVDRTAEGLVAIYVPGVPNPRSGALSYVTADRVESIDAGFKAITKTCKKLGRGSGALLAGQPGSR
jgi:uncharacterized membrane protein